MTRVVLPPDAIHPAIQSQIGGGYQDTLNEVQQAIAEHPVVVVGMAQNPVVKKVRRVLSDAGVTCHYLEYGSYLVQWRRRTAIKMWSGWQTFPQIFVRGQLVGGCQEVEQLLKQGEFNRLLEQE